MIKRFTSKLHSRGGFTLAETMLATLILVIVFGIVAAGIPSAVNSFEGVVDSANAQLLLSTTMTCLKDEIGKASDVSCSGSSVYYTGQDGIRRVMECGSSEGIKIRLSGSDQSYLLVSGAAANNDLYVTYTIDEAYSGGVLSFSDLSVRKGSKTLIKVDTFKVKVITDAR